MVRCDNPFDTKSKSTEEVTRNKLWFYEPMKEGTIMSEKSSSGILQVAIALIGILGSLGVAFITTGYQFKEELHKGVG